ncbi:MAG: hypothetical protein KA715_04790 [Xanthomonadaceae bacterium]|nr:hypothetical protein [Xanthomonadaceae bacterium]
MRKKNLDQGVKIVSIVLVTYFLSDLTAMLVEKWIPPAPQMNQRSGSTQASNPKNTMNEDAYEIILSRNLFDSTGLTGDGEFTAPTQLHPVKSILPLTLVGTAILTDSKRSIGTVEDRGSQLIYPLRINDEVTGKLRVTNVEARRLVFVNLSNNRLEYIELPEDQMHSNPIITASSSKKPFSPTSTGGIKKISETQFNVSRAEIDKAMSNFGVVLTQALAKPNFENGVQNGFKITQIVPGSVYDKIGLKDGEVILGLNNESVNDPAKAFQMLNELKTSNHLEIKVKTVDGKEITRVYDIN